MEVSCLHEVYRHSNALDILKQITQEHFILLLAYAMEKLFYRDFTLRQHRVI